MKGLSRSNPQYMRSFAEAWPAFDPNVPRPVGHVPWGRIRTPRQTSRAGARDSYSAAAVQHGWSRNVLMNMIMNKTLERTGAAPATPRCTGLRGPQQVAKDPYNFEFLGLSGEVAEGGLETALTSRITQTLPGFAFVGRQVHFDVRR